MIYGPGRSQISYPVCACRCTSKEGNGGLKSKGDQISVISVPMPRFLTPLLQRREEVVYLGQKRRSIGLTPQSPLLKFLIFSLCWCYHDCRDVEGMGCRVQVRTLGLACSFLLPSSWFHLPSWPSHRLSSSHCYRTQHSFAGLTAPPRWTDSHWLA